MSRPIEQPPIPQKLNKINPETSGTSINRVTRRRFLLGLTAISTSLLLNRQSPRTEASASVAGADRIRQHGDSGGGHDGGSHDSGSHDSGNNDSGSHDSGNHDSGSHDSGNNDSSSSNHPDNSHQDLQQDHNQHLDSGGQHSEQPLHDSQGDLHPHEPNHEDLHPGQPNHEDLHPEQPDHENFHPEQPHHDNPPPQPPHHDDAPPHSPTQNKPSNTTPQNKPANEGVRIDANESNSESTDEANPDQAIVCADGDNGEIAEDRDGDNTECDPQTQETDLTPVLQYFTRPMRNALNAFKLS